MSAHRRSSLRLIGDGELRLDAVAPKVTVSNSVLTIWVGSLLTVALHMAFCGLYGYQRDELYFLACGRHLAWGYVDQPPLIALVADIAVRLFGESLAGLRFIPALAAGALVALSAAVTRRFGGGPFAVGLAMLAVALAPFDLAVGSLLTMNAFEPLFWLCLTLLVVEQLDRPAGWRWAAIGLVIGIGVLNKWSMAIDAGCLLGGVIISPARRMILGWPLGVAIGIAALVAAPNVAWQAQHGWPQLQMLHNADLAKNERLVPALFLLEQLPLMNPFCAPLWLAGLWALARSPRYAGVAIAYAMLLVVELVLHGKVYYVAPTYPFLIAVGAVAIESASRQRMAVRAGLTAALVLGGVVLMPLATPALPIKVLLTYQRALDVRSLKMENHPVGLLPQQFADQLGWDELETTIARVVATLPDDERAGAAILTADYGQAAALDFLGRRDRLPPAISGHNQYYIWGPRGDHPVIVAIGIPQALLAREYRSIERVATYRSAYVLPQNSDLPVYLCREPRQPLAQFWPKLRRYV